MCKKVFSEKFSLKTVQALNFKREKFSDDVQCPLQCGRLGEFLRVSNFEVQSTPQPKAGLKLSLLN